MDSTTNYSETQTASLDWTLIPCYTIALIAVLLRLYCRRTLGRAGLWWDDWAIFMAMVCYRVLEGAYIASGELTAFQVPATAAMIIYAASLRQTLGHHIYAIGLEAFTPFLKDFFIMEYLYVATLACVKASILLFYWRLFAVSARIPIILVATLLGLWTVASILVATFQCTPINYFWNRLTGETGTCINTQTFYLGVSIPNIVEDFMLAILPLPYIARLKLRMVQKILLAGIFCLGIFVASVSIVRIDLFMRQNMNDPDITYNLVSVFIWSIVEIMVGITCACLPAFPPALKVVGRLFSRLNSHMPSWLSSGSSTKIGTLTTGRSAHSAATASGNRKSHKLERIQIKDPYALTTIQTSPISPASPEGALAIPKSPSSRPLSNSIRNFRFSDPLNREGRGQLPLDLEFDDLRKGLTHAERESCRDVGVDAEAWGKSSAEVEGGRATTTSSVQEVELSPDEVKRSPRHSLPAPAAAPFARGGYNGERAEIINVRSSWTVRYDTEDHPEAQKALPPRVQSWTPQALSRLPPPSQPPPGLPPGPPPPPPPSLLEPSSTGTPEKQS